MIVKDNILKISFSALETYQQCPRKYLYNYIWKLPRKDWPWLILGTFVHLVLEKFHRYVIYFKKRNLNFEYDELMKKAFLSALKIQRKKESKGEMRFSDDQKEKSKKILSDYLKRIVKKFPNTIYIEKGFDFIFEDINIRGFIDRIDKIDDDTFKLVDYKTSSKSYDINEKKQLDLYSYFFKNLLKRKDIKIIRCLDFLKLNEIKEGLYEKSHEEQVLDYIKTTSKKIKDNMKSEKEEDWKFKVNNYCKLCDFKDRCSQQRGIFI